MEASILASQACEDYLHALHVSLGARQRILWRLPSHRQCMKWDAFTILEQLLILLTIGSQLYIAFRIIMQATGAEQYVRAMSFCSGLLLFLLSRPLGLTFADLMLAAQHQSHWLSLIIIGGVMPFLVGVVVSEATIIALRLGNPIPMRIMLIMGAFTVSQAAYTNYVALTTQVTTLDKAFIPNLCYAIAIGIWLAFRYRESTTQKA